MLFKSDPSRHQTGRDKGKVLVGLLITLDVTVATTGKCKTLSVVVVVV